ncbi:MAG: GNAT family N-acetyltransferase [Pseudomonadales bacterium]
MSAFRPRDVHIFRPYADELPWELLASVAADEEALAGVLELNLVRVAKYDDRVLGAYGIRPLSTTRFELVVLVVAEGYRRKGLGRWLLGHALGLAESKGAREVVMRGHNYQRFLSRVGFEPDGADLLLRLSPE